MPILPVALRAVLLCVLVYKLRVDALSFLWGVPLPRVEALVTWQFHVSLSEELPDFTKRPHCHPHLAGTPVSLKSISLTTMGS